MNYKKEEIDLSVITGIANEIRKYWKDEERKAKDDIYRRFNGKEREKRILKNRTRYSRIRSEDETLILEGKLRQLRDKVRDKSKIKKVYDLVETAGNTKSKKVIERHLHELSSEIFNINEEAKKILGNGKVKRPNTLNESVSYVSMDGDEFYVGDTALGVDAYSDLFRMAFNNETQKENIILDKKEPLDANTYIGEELQELEDVDEFWKSNEFGDYISKLEVDNPKEAQKYKKAQMKKRQAVFKLSQLYKELSDSRASIDKIEEALNELRNQKLNLPENVYKKAEKSLLSQKKREDIRNRKIEAKKNKIFQKTGLRNSINNARNHKNLTGELEGLKRQDILNENLIQMKNILRDAEQKLQEEYKKSTIIPEEKIVEVRGGDAYETGETNPASRTNMEAINKAEEEVKKIKQGIINQEKIIVDNNKNRERLENAIEKISEREVNSTIKGEKENLKALPEGQVNPKVVNNHETFSNTIRVEVNEKDALKKVENEQLSNQIDKEEEFEK